MLLFISAMLLGSASIAAPPPAAQPDEDQVITVQGRRNEKQEVRSFVRSLTLADPDMPLARFNGEVCPQAVGLSPRLDAAITERMRKIAAAAAIPLSKAGCRPNVLLLLAEDKNEMVKALRSRHKAWFVDATETPIQIPDEKGPALAWQVGGMLDRSGQAVPRAVPPDDYAGAYVLNSPVGPSRISMAMRPVHVGAMVIVEKKALEGLTTTQIADYALLRAFAANRPESVKKAGAATILNILDAGPDDEVPITMTEWDFGYLKALHETSPYRSGLRQKSEISTAIIRDIEERRKRP